LGIRNNTERNIEMRTKMSLIAAAAMALALMGFASSALAATDGVVRDVTDNSIIPENRELHFVGFARFDVPSVGANYRCHVTSVVKITGATGTTGHVKVFTVPDKTKCTGGGTLANCTLTAFSNNTEGATPWHVTATPTDFDVTGNIVINNTFGGPFCLVSGSSATLTFSAITLKPLKTGANGATGTANHLGTTAAAGEPIAGAEIEGTGTVSGAVSGEAKASGELELTEPDRCTWKLASS
jgi:hypothetical protein